MSKSYHYKFGKCSIAKAGSVFRLDMFGRLVLLKIGHCFYLFNKRVL